MCQQPLLELGYVLLHRGIGKATQYDLFQMPRQSALLNRYHEALYASFSDSVISFKAAHASVRRTETGHLLDLANYFWISSLDNALLKVLKTVNRCYILHKEIAQNKF